MITKNDCLLLLSELEDNGVNKEELEQVTHKLILSKDVNLEVLDFINKHRQLEVAAFYEQLRHNYNQKKSKLYKNIVKEIDDTQEVLTTLSALLTQILLYSKKCENSQLFLKHSRAKEITLVLTKYFEDYDISVCLQLLRLIKADLKCLEEIRH